MKIITTLILAFCAFTFTAEARLGETRAECAARYGEYFDTLDDIGYYFFAKSGLLIIIRFDREGLADYLMYGPKKGERNEDISESEAGALAEANFGSEIQRIDNTASIVWTSKTMKAFASYGKFNHELTIATVAGAERLMADKKELAKKELGGF